MKTGLVTTLLVLSASAFAAPPPLNVSAGYSADVISSRSFDLVGEDDHLPYFRVAAGYTLNPSVGPLDVELAFHTGGSGAMSHQSVQSGLGVNGLELGGTLRRSVWRYFEPYAHAGVGFDWATLTLEGAERLSETVGRPMGNAMIGFQIPMPLLPTQDHSPAGVIDVGFGYVLRPSYGFHDLAPTPQGNPPSDAIPSAGVNLGNLAMSGFTYRILLAFRL